VTGACACQNGLTSCTIGGTGGALCVDTQSNPFACGGCGKPCAANEQCQAGACQPTSTGCTDPTPDACPSGNGRVACVNFNTDPIHCGDCGTVCDPGQTCVGGNCQ
jgi:hypothetical protein